MKIKGASWVVALLVLAAASTAMCSEQGVFQLGESSKQPIEITTEKLTSRWVPEGVEVTLLGNVRIRQGDVTLTCDKFVLVYDREQGDRSSKPPGLPKDLQSWSKVRSMIAEGKVKMVQDDRMATAVKAKFDNARRTLTLTGGPPRLWQGADVVAAHTIIIYLDENRAEAHSGENNQIKVTINPGKKKPEEQ